MKKSFSLFAALLLVAFTSCSGEKGDSKEISPKQTEFQSGNLAKLVEVVDEPAELSYSETEGAISTQYIRLKVKLKLVKESPELQNVSAQDIHFYKLLAVATIDLLDEDGNKLNDLDVKDEDMLKLKKFLQGKEGDTEVITFEGTFHNDDAKKLWFDTAVNFVPSLTGDVEAGDDATTVATTESYAAEVEETSFESDGGILSGSLIGDDDNVDATGSSVRSSGGSEDWNSILNSYERYVDRYIAAVKKSKNGDTSALADMASLLQEAEELGDKLENAKSDMSASQMARYTRINAKMVKAAQGL